MANNVGIENLKNGVSVIIKLGEAADTSLADGKFQVSELFNFLQPLMQVPGIIENKDKVLAELKNLDDAEMQQISATVKSELQLSNPNTEKIVEAAVDTLIQLARLSAVIKEAKTTPDA